MGGSASHLAYLLNVHEWNIGIVQRSISAFLDPTFSPDIIWLPKPSLIRYQADPFGVYHDGRLVIFFEQLAYNSVYGQICYVEVAADGTVSAAKPVMELPIHMSYPYLFEHHGVIYCIPETSQAREIALFRCEEFPYTWRKIHTLIAGESLVDSSLIHYQQRWWLFCGYVDYTQHPEQRYELRIWYADDLPGQWLPHAHNPVKFDCHASRPAGTPFIHQGQLYRPAQDCVPVYGGRIIIHRVTELTPESFREEPVTIVAPRADSPFRDGIHTISAVGEITLLDGFRTSSPAPVQQRLVRAVARGSKILRVPPYQWQLWGSKLLRACVNPFRRSKELGR